MAMLPIAIERSPTSCLALQRLVKLDRSQHQRHSDEHNEGGLGGRPG